MYYKNVLLLFKNVRGVYKPLSHLDKPLLFVIGSNNYIWYERILDSNDYCYANHYYYCDLFIKNNRYKWVKEPYIHICT